MNRAEAAKRAEKLREEIRLRNYEYFVLDKSHVSEAVRDALKKELIEIEKNFPELITPDSPTQRVGSVLSGKFRKVKHKTPKKSLQDAFSDEDLRDWHQRISKLVPGEKIEYLCELKIDGLNITVNYEHGRLIQAATRGNGIEGEEVTHTVKTIESIPLTLARPVDLEVSGEVFIPKASFAKINQEEQEKGLEPFANPRNAAAGTIRQLDPKIAAGRNLDAFFYSLGSHNLSDKISTQAQALEVLKSLGLKVSPRAQICPDIEEVIKYCHSWRDHRDNLPYEIDGIVIKVNDLAQHKKMAFTAKAPRFMIAWKFPATQGAAKILNILVQVGRTGALTPVAVLTPTFVAGSTISRATLHNQDEINRKDIRIGDTVVIQKAGDVIPEVVEVLKNLRTGNEKKYHIPSKCPICGHPIIQEDGEAISRCSNKACYAQESEGIIHFVSKNALDIDGLGPKVILQLIDRGLISDSADIFTLKKEDFLSLELFKEKRSDNLIAAIEHAKKVPLERLIFGLGIRHLGEGGSEDFSRYLTEKAQQEKTIIAKDGTHWLQLIDVLKMAEKLTEEELLSIDGIGEKVVSSLTSWFKNPRHQKLLQKLHTAGVITEIRTGDKKAQKLEGQTFVITGTLARMTREQAKERIKKAGGKVLSTVSANTDFLVCGENPGSKLEKAKELDIKILSEAEFEKIF